MYFINNEKRKKAIKGRNRTIKSRKNQNFRRNEYHQIHDDERKYLKKQTSKLLETKHCKILRTILEIDERRTSTNRPENKKANNDA